MNSSIGHCSPRRGKIISGAGGPPGDGHICDLSGKEGQIVALLCTL